MGPLAPGLTLMLRQASAFEDSGLHVAVLRHGFIDALAKAPVGVRVNQLGAGLLVEEALD